MTDEQAGGAPIQIGDEHYTCDVSIVNEMGLHARPASLMVGIASKFPCEIVIYSGSNIVDGKSILQLLSLSAEMGTKLKLETRGTGAREAIEALAQLVHQGFSDPPAGG